MYSSLDLVLVYISGREVDNFSFVDLHGIVASVHNSGREEDIEEAGALLTSLVNKPSCLIFMALSHESASHFLILSVKITSTVDLRNQGACRLANC